LLLQTPKLDWPKEIKNGTQVRYQRCTSIKLKKQLKQLTRVGFLLDLKEQTNMALYFLKKSGEFDAVVREWESKPTALKTWANIKTFISAEYSKTNTQNKLTAKQFRANAVEEQAEATEELITQLTEAHTHQMKTLIKSTTEVMKEILNLMKSQNTHAKTPNSDNEDKKKKCKDKQNKYCDAPICKNCNKKHQSKTEDKCWELPKNAPSCPASWKSKKST
jgi:hypothetical protein